jgi:hypothetical protein
VKQLAVMVLVGASCTTAALARDVTRDTPGPGNRSVSAAQAPSAARCGGTLWRMKTFSDVDRNHVQLTAKSTTIGAIRALTPPKGLPRRRSTTFQKQTWEVVGSIVYFRREGTELRLQLYDHEAYLTAAIPAPTCLSGSTRARQSILAAWSAFMTACGRPNSSWQPLGAVAYIRGVGFWGKRDSGRGAPNGAELHPVTGLRIVIGCGG